jgi:hypothetical protein
MHILKIDRFLAQPVLKVGFLYLYRACPSVGDKMSGALSMN